MDKKLFEQKLSEVAEWQMPKLTPTDIKESKRRARGRRPKEDIYQEQHEEVFLDMFNGTNPTMAPEVLKLKKSSTICEDCGLECPNGRHSEKKLYDTGGKKNWRERCLTCERSKNPFTGRFELTFSEASHVWTDYLKDRKGAYKTKKIIAIQQQIKEPSKTVIETDTGTITFYGAVNESDK